mmetsp:Transcript_1268/g.2589  ORF Transcript_1268/g.2589 Transcript_1268/m.2589 type:complete len:276 (-) Transcript_1268:41-868(-)
MALSKRRRPPLPPHPAAGHPLRDQDKGQRLRRGRGRRAVPRPPRGRLRRPLPPHRPPPADPFLRVRRGPLHRPQDGPGRVLHQQEPDRGKHPSAAGAGHVQLRVRDHELSGDRPEPGRGGEAVDERDQREQAAEGGSEPPGGRGQGQAGEGGRGGGGGAVSERGGGGAAANGNRVGAQGVHRGVRAASRRRLVERRYGHFTFESIHGHFVERRRQHAVPGARSEGSIEPAVPGVKQLYEEGEGRFPVIGAIRVTEARSVTSRLLLNMGFEIVQCN